MNDARLDFVSGKQTLWVHAQSHLRLSGKKR
jgi:hypothetical protein